MTKFATGWKENKRHHWLIAIKKMVDRVAHELGKMIHEEEREHKSS